MACRWLVAAVLGATLASGARADYTITDLGVIPGGSTSHGIAISNTGYVAGYGDGGSLSSHAFRTTAGAPSLTDLGTLGGSTSHGMAVNSAGVVVGDSTLSNAHTQAFFAAPGLPTQALPMLGGWTDSYATGVNDKGLVAGYAMVSGVGNRAFLGTVNGPAVVQLGTLGGGGSMAFGINGLGTLVGSSETATGQTHAFVSDGVALTDLGGLGTSGFSVGLAINNAGVVVGYGGMPGAQHAFRAQPGGPLEDLFSLSGSGGTSAAYAVNNLGAIVGSSSTPGSGTHAFLIGPGSGSMTDLNLLLPPGSGWLLINASGINDQGQITGTGLFQGQTHAFLLSPPSSVVPEPPAWLLTGLGGLGLLTWSRRRAPRDAVVTPGVAARKVE